MSLKRRKWEKPFRWKSQKEGKVDLSEITSVVNQLVLLGNDMAFQMMRAMLATEVTSKEFCDSQNNWNRYLFDRATPSRDGVPAPVSFKPAPHRSQNRTGGQSYDTARQGRKASSKRKR